MPKYDIFGIVQGTKYLGQIKAKNKREAEEKALASENCYVSLCNHCSRECEDPEIHRIEVVRVKT